jgi:hypothetical protein
MCTPVAAAVLTCMYALMNYNEIALETLLVSCCTGSIMFEHYVIDRQ